MACDVVLVAVSRASRQAPTANARSHSLTSAPMTDSNDQQSLEDKIAELERRLHDAKARLKPSSARMTAAPTISASDAGALSVPTTILDHCMLILLQLSMHCCCSPTRRCRWALSLSVAA